MDAAHCRALSTWLPHLEWRLGSQWLAVTPKSSTLLTVLPGMCPLAIDSFAVLAISLVRESGGNR
jgi:hypothetical protein